MSPQSSARSSKLALDEGAASPPPPDLASDNMLVPSADSAAGMGIPSDPEPGSSKVSVSTYVRETAMAVCTVFEEAPAVGAVCKTLLAVEKLVGTAKVNKDELEVLLELCDVVTRGFLDRCSEPCVPLERVSSLRRHVDSAKRVTALCNKGRFARFALGRKISKNITSVKTNVVNFATVNNLALSGDLHAKLGKMEEALAAKEREMQLAEEREKQAAEERERERAAERERQRADERTRKNAEGRERRSLERMQKRHSLEGIDKQSFEGKQQLRPSLEGTDKQIFDGNQRQSLEGNQRHSFGGVGRESLQGQQRPSFEGRDRQSFEGKEKQRAEGKEKQRVEDEARSAAAKTKTAPDPKPAAALIGGAKVPAAAPRIRIWYAQRPAIVGEACDRLCSSSNSDTAGDAPRIVGLAGPGGAGKSTVASMVIAREDVRVYFRSGILWLPVGHGAKHRLPELMLSVAKMVYEVVLKEEVRPPLMPAFGGCAEDGVEYIREVVGQGHHRYLVVADDVCEPEVLEALKSTGAWVLYTSRFDAMLPKAPIRLNEIFIEEAALVMRGAARLTDADRLPNVAYELMERCEFNVMDLAFIGSWGAVHGRTDAEAWRAALVRIADTREGGEKGGAPPLPWRTAVLHAGLEALAEDDPNNKKLYLCLAVIPRRLGFAAENAAALLFGEDFSADDLKAAIHVLATLERWAILALDGEGKYHLHEVHAEFIRELLPMHQDAGIKALQRWRAHISSVRALLTWSDEELVDIWHVYGTLEGTPVATRPYDAALEALEISDCRLSTALRQAGHFHWLAGHPAEACKKWTKLLAITEEKLGGYHPHVADTLQHLGECALVAGRTKEAEGLYRRALGIRAENLGTAHPLVTHTQRCLDLSMQKQPVFPAVRKKPVIILVTGVLLAAVWGQRLARSSSR